jgi:hypothetical protein
MYTFSSIFTTLLSFILEEWPVFTAIFIGIGIEILSRSIKSRMKSSIFAKYENSVDPKHAEFYLSYYRKIQSLDIFRAISVLVVLFIVFTFKTGGSVNFLVVGIGALIVIMKDFILSILAFFFILRQYQIGDTIGIGDIQWQIIYIRVFSIGILGKDNDGDNTGRMFVVPGHRLITESIRKEDLHSNSIRKELLRIPFESDKFSLDFSAFLEALEGFLDGHLPTLSKKNCGNYQTYIGHKYKLDIDYFEDKCITITIWLVGKWEETVENKKKIISFVESKRSITEDIL